MKPKVGIQEFFAEKTVLITGGTGFVGKCLVEKLLRDCPEVKMILLIIRGRDGASSQERFEKYFTSQEFDRIRGTQDLWRDKLGLIPGDITLPNCGLATEDLQAISSVQVVIHSAAAISFHMPLAKIVRLNVGGTKNILELALAMPQIQALVYVSTAFCMPSHLLVEEKVYNTEISPHGALNTFDGLPKEWMASLTPKITGERNTYQYSKHLAENLVHSFRDQLPVCIVRPGAILASYKEPFPGWNDTESFLSIFFNVVFRGDSNSVLGDVKLPYLCTPADVAVNTILAGAWKQSQMATKTCSVYNCIPFETNPLLPSDIVPWAYERELKNPSSTLTWYPWTYVTNSKLLFTLRFYLLRGIPAFIADLCGSKSHGMSNITALKRLKQLIIAYAKFGKEKRKFTTENMKALHLAMSPDDRKSFPLDMGAICWKDFIQSFALGLEKFSSKSKPSRASSLHMLRLRLVHYMMETAFFVLLLIVPSLALRNLVRLFGFSISGAPQKKE